MTCSAIYRIWRVARKNKNDLNIDAFVCPSKKCGEKMAWFKYCYDDIKTAIKELSKGERKTIQLIAKALALPKSLVSHLSKEVPEIKLGNH
jgi:uncharacterized membrane protein YebE (DUF533 family)